MLAPLPPRPLPDPQAKDTQNEKRTTGGDKFAVKVVSRDGQCEGVARVVDMLNGTYQVRFLACPCLAYRHGRAVEGLRVRALAKARAMSARVLCWGGLHRAQARVHAAWRPAQSQACMRALHGVVTCSARE